jgi:NAD(P)-dependent dehydrogenase (short-subunit alcohol dehydrogenase family)
MLTQQTPIDSGFASSTTAEDVIKGCDLHGKIAIVTGGYSGIGLETVRTLRSAGAKVIVPARDLKKAESALAGIEAEIKEMDLIDPSSIDRFAESFIATGQALHLLVNSAGIMACPLTRDARGYESQFATNHLGHFQLTGRLWPALLKANGARVASVSSWGHRRSPIVFDDPNFEHREYDRWDAYGQSKTGNILFALALDSRGKDKGIRAFSLHPGAILATGLQKYVTQEELRAFGVIGEDGEPILDPAKNMKTVPQGAATSVWCAAGPQLDNMGGVYCENCDIAPLVDDATNVNNDKTRRTPATFMGVMPYAIDPEAAERLWNLSEKLTDTAY